MNRRIPANTVLVVALVMLSLLVLSPALPLSGAHLLLPDESLPAEGDGSGSSAPNAGSGGSGDPMELQGDLVSAFYYQGFLTEDGGPVNGTREMEFQLWNTEKIPEQVGVTLTRTVTVQDGQFNTSLGWGPNEINGRGLTLQVRVRDSSGAWQALPRDNILAVPYAISLRPGAKIIGEDWDTTVTVQNKSGDGVSSSGTDTGVLGITTSEDENEAGVRGVALNTRGRAKGGIFASATGTGLSGSSLSLHGVEGKGCGLPHCYGGYFTGDNGVYGESDDVTPNSFAGNFVGNVKVSDDLTVDGQVVLRGEIYGLNVRERARLGAAYVTGTVQASSLVVEGTARGFFPRPMYDTGWVGLGRGNTRTFNHDLGGSPDDLIADFQCRDTASDGLGIHILGHGALSVTNPPQPLSSRGAYYRNLTSTTVRVYRLGDDDYCDQVRVRLWRIY